MTYFYGTGRRKQSVARVFLSKGNGQVTVNAKPAEEYFTRKTDQVSALSPFVVIGHENKFNAKITVKGGGVTGQADAIRHGIARALLQATDEIKLDDEFVAKRLAKFQLSTATPEAGDTLESAVEEATGEDSEGEKGTTFMVRKLLKMAGFLTRDSRKKERRKFGLARKARKSKQFSKR